MGGRLDPWAAGRPPRLSASPSPCASRSRGLSHHRGPGERNTLRIVATGINGLRGHERALIVLTHDQRLLKYIVPDVIHVLFEGRIVKSGDKRPALLLEQQGYRWI
jgi:hypothetical protein